MLKKHRLMRYSIGGLVAMVVVSSAPRAQPSQRPPAGLGGPSSSVSRPQLVPQLGHVAEVNSVEFSHDGRQVLTGDVNETVLWDAVTGRELRRFLGSGGTFSPNGKQVLTGGRENTARVWDVATGREVRAFFGGEGTFSPDGRLVGRRFVDNALGTLALRLTGYTETVSSVALSPDGKLILTSSSDNTVRVWDVATGREVRRFFGGEGAFSPDGKQVLTGSYDNTVGRWDIPASQADKTVRLWDVSTGQQVCHFTGHNDRVNLVAFSPDGKYVLTGSKDNTARLWDAATGQELRPFLGHTSFVQAVAFSPNGKQVLTESYDNTVRIWNVATGREVRRFFGGEGTFSPDGKRVLTSSSDNTVRLWDVATGQEVRRFAGHNDGVTSVAFSSDGKQLLAGSKNRTVRLWDVTGREVRLFTGQTVGVNSVAFSPDGKQMIVGSADNTAWLWDVATGRKVRRFKGHTGGVNSAAFSPDGKQALTVSSDNTVRLWNVATGQEVGRFTGYTSTVSSAVFSSDGKQVLTGGRDHAGGRSDMAIRHGDVLIVGGRAATPQWSARLWDAATRKEVQQDAATGKEAQRISLPGADITAITSVALSPDGKHVLTSSADDVVRLWEIATRQEVGRFYGTHGTFSPDGKQVLMAGGRDNTARLGNIITPYNTTELRVQEVRPFAGHTNTVLAVAFSRDGKHVLTGSKDNTARLWDALTGQGLHPFLGHTGFIRSVAISPDGKQALTGSYDNTVRIWDAATGKELCTVFSFSDGTRAVVDAAGRFDADDLDQIKGFSWVVHDDPFTPLSPEIFMRDYYEPRLLSRILKGDKFCELPSLAELNRVQPKVEGIKVIPKRSHNGLVTVKVEVSSKAGQCLKDGEHAPCESGVYDLRLYRDGQLVGQAPGPTGDVTTSSCPGAARKEQLQQWRESSVVTTNKGQPVTTATGKQQVTFTDIRLPRRAGVTQVEFTAYAFNKDRVKSPTSEPAVYPLAVHGPTVRRRAYIVTVGVDATSDPGLRLGFAPNGARDVEKMLKTKLQSQYEVVTVPLISEYKEDSTELAQNLATKSNLKTVLNILSGRDLAPAQRQPLPSQEQLRAATPDDLVLLYIASHGYADPNGKFYVVPSDIGEPAGVTKQLLDRCLKGLEQSSSCESAREFLRHSISSDELTQWLQTIDAGQMVLVLDSCHSGAVSGPGFKPGPMGDRGFGQLSYDKGMLVLAATQGENVAWGTLELGDRSLLTYALTKEHSPGQSFDLRKWLADTERQVPDLYRRFVTAIGSPLDQEPTLFDFSRGRFASHFLRELQD